ncbi:heterokaryon incompatibility protein-domain-containing protein [Hypoxylon sp. NC1633]|nr:heterokaryon incompatibility protein-domain-containing protein [Hypoxylon sp. NC1633]
MSLCHTCERLSINSLDRGPSGRHQDLVRELHSSVAKLESCASRCDLCRVFWASISIFCPPAVLQTLRNGGSYGGETRVFFLIDSAGNLPRLIPKSIINPLQVKLSENARKIHLFLGPSPSALNLGFVDILAKFGSPAASIIRGRIASGNDSSQFRVNMTKEWLLTCDHESCGNSSPRPMPTRVIDLGSGSPRLLDTHGRPGVYVALSYCWGQGRGIHKIKLRSENYDEFRTRGINESKMTLAHREGLQVTRELGYRYIWIDALCIIQGSDQASRDDWARESVRIPEVYGNAVLTVVAGRSDDSRKGFLKYQNNPAMDPKNAPSAVKCELPGGKTDACLLGIERSQDVGATDTRAWCFQEAILSRRMLIFGTEQLSFRCRECIYFEDGKFRACGDRNEWYDYTIPKDWTRRADVLNAWYEIAVEYSKRDFFDPCDNFAAISGVAQQFQSALRENNVKPRYLAGLWESDMIRGLLWKSMRLIDETQPPLRKPIAVSGAHQNQEIRTAPSWSWLGLRGPISQDVGKAYNPIMLDPTAYRCLPKSPKVWAGGNWDPVLVKHEDMPLPFKLDVRGSLREVRVSAVAVSQYPAALRWTGYYGIKPVARHAVLLEAAEKPALKEATLKNYNTVVAIGLFDLGGQPASTRIWAMLLTHDEGLLLQRTPDGYYERLGVFHQQWGYEQGSLQDIVLI